MPHFSQENSPLKVFTPLPEGTLLATRLSGWERLGDSFEFTLDLLAPRGASVSFGDLLGKSASASVTQASGVVRHYHGEIWEFTQNDSDDRFDHYLMVLRPRLARLSLTRQSRIFQGKTAVDILRVVLKQVGGAKIEVSNSPPVRGYCTQYRENDLEFFLRICSEAGITHYWEHSEVGHQLMLTDKTPNGPFQGELIYDQTVGGSHKAPFFHAWKLTQVMSTTGVALRDSHFQLFGQRLEGEANSPSPVAAGDLSLQSTGSVAAWQEDEYSAARSFDEVSPSGETQPGVLSSIFDGQERRARFLATAAASGSVRARAVGNCCQLMTGHAFSLIGHPNQSGKWLVVAGRHEISVQGRSWVGETCDVRCELQAELAPLALAQAPWPPRPRPRVSGVQTGIVIGPEGEEVFVDRFGRVQVRFWWDRDDNTYSCWIRVAQSWAGNSWGAMFWPRVGHEVVVSFENGDPDRPIIVGSVYNSTNMPPYHLPEHKYIAGWKSLTQGGDPSKNYHLVLMSDETNAEVVHIHAERSFITHQESVQVSMRPNVDMSFQG